MVPECMEMSRNQRFTERIRHSQPQHTRRFPVACGVQQHFPGKVADMLGITQGIPACIRQRNRMADAVEKRNTQFFFQLFDLKGNGRLGIAQLFTHLGEAAQFRHFHKNCQRFDVHACLPELIFYMFNEILFMI